MSEKPGLINCTLTSGLSLLLVLRAIIKKVKNILISD